MYHYTRDLINSRYPTIRGLDRSLFEEQLIFFKENYNVVRMEDVIECFESTKELPEKSLLLTFDDGYIDNYTVALPLLKKYGFQGSFFIPAKTFCENKMLDVNKIHFILAVVQNDGGISNLIQDIMKMINEYRDSYKDILDNDLLYKEYAVASRFDDKDTIFCKRVLQNALPEIVRNDITSRLFAKYVGVEENIFARELYLDREQIALMKREGMFIGVHGYDHYWLGKLEPTLMRTDIDKALDSMKDYIEPDKWVINYPYGSYNNEVIDYVSSKGCVLAFTSEVGIALLEENNKYVLPRLDCNDFPPKSNNYERY